MDRKPSTDQLLALDVGLRRIGVAVASPLARLPRPLTTLHNDAGLWPELAALCHRESVGIVVVGLPRGLDGQETAQTAYSRDFAEQVRHQLGIAVALQDEALTSRQARAELAASKKSYQRGDIDALAATYILEDYLRDQAPVTGQLYEKHETI